MSNRPYTLARAVITKVQQLDPVFVRLGLELTSGALPTAQLALDQRIKIVVPTRLVAGCAPVVPVPLPAGEFSTILKAIHANPTVVTRTVSVRRWYSEGGRDCALVDIALHEGEDCGPLARFCAAAEPGWEVQLIVPEADPATPEHRLFVPSSGVEFAPGHAQKVLLVGDETALPAISRIVSDASVAWPGLDVAAIATVPEACNPAAVAPSVQARWVPRKGLQAPVTALPEVVAHTAAWLGRAAHSASLSATFAEEAQAPASAETLVWETARFSAAGLALDDAASQGTGGASQAHNQLPYIWIAGESSLVTGLRRILVREWNLPRSQVAFMGYWKSGTAMRG